MKGVFRRTITRDDAWLLEIAKIPQEMRDEEAALMQSRWFDYRSLLPAQATLLFSRLYVKLYREYFAKTRDADTAANVVPLIHRDLFESPDLLPFWSARQAADQIGCRYEFYIDFAFARFLERGFRYMPRPNQLYGEAMVLDIYSAWEELKKCTLQLAKTPRFKAGSYTGHPDQDAYHAYLVEQVKAREHRYMFLARLVYRDGVLPVKIAEAHFSEEELRRARFYERAA